MRNHVTDQKACLPKKSDPRGSLYKFYVIEISRFDRFQGEILAFLRFWQSF